MTDVDIVEFLNTRYDEDELWAREASREGDSPVPDGGVHWQWMDNETDEVVELHTDTMEFVDDGRTISLRSRERFPNPSTSPLPQFAIGAAEEVPIAVGGHIVRHDPARVLADIAAKRGIVRRARSVSDGLAREMRDNPLPMGSPTIGERDLLSTNAAALIMACKLLALPYADHPDYKPAWKIEG